MKRLPLVASLIVLAAVATMIALGLWQLRRAAEKKALLARYAAAQGLPPIAWPAPGDAVLFRRSALACVSVSGWRSASGRNRAGEAGWVHLADCRTPAGPATVVAGWSMRPAPPAWSGGRVAGVIGPDRDRGIRLIAATAAPGLAPARPPSLEDVPDNHLFYAVQWFFFAAAAAAIYVLALRRRHR